MQSQKQIFYDGRLMNKSGETMYAGGNSQDGKYSIFTSQQVPAASSLENLKPFSHCDDRYLYGNGEENSLDLHSMFYQNAVANTGPNMLLTEVLNKNHSDASLRTPLPI